MGHAADPALILRDLRRARHRRHREDVDWVETLYRVYVTVLMGATVVWLSASKVTDKAAQPGGLADIQAHGAAALGVLAAFLVALGIRSGSRGGPLSLAAADVRVVLLSPIRRRLALRAPALHQVRSAAFAGLCVGIVAGNLAGNRLPGRFIGWVVAGAGFGLLTAVLAVGAALVACGLRLSRPVGAALGAALLGWSAADMAAGSVTSPLTLLGRIALASLPGEVSGGSVVASVVGGVGLTAAVLVLAALRLGHISLEAAERRGRLAAQLRFALSLQDLRAVILLRRRLASEEPRGRPWFQLGNRGGGKRTPSAAGAPADGPEPAAVAGSPNPAGGRARRDRRPGRRGCLEGHHTAGDRGRSGAVHRSARRPRAPGPGMGPPHPPGQLPCPPRVGWRPSRCLSPLWSSSSRRPPALLWPSLSSACRSGR